MKYGVWLEKNCKCSTPHRYHLPVKILDSQHVKVNDPENPFVWHNWKQKSHTDFADLIKFSQTFKLFPTYWVKKKFQAHLKSPVWTESINQRSNFCRTEENKLIQQNKVKHHKHQIIKVKT